MKAFKNFKITLFLCAAAVICCVAVLAGTTYAWFSSSATGKVTIQSGTFDIGVTTYGTTNEPTYSKIDTITAATGTELSATTFDSSTHTYYLIKVTNSSATIDVGVTITVNDSSSVSEVYSGTSSQITGISGYYKIAANNGSIYFTLSGSSSSTKLTVTAYNLVNDSTLGDFKSAVTNGNTGG